MTNRPLVAVGLAAALALAVSSASMPLRTPPAQVKAAPSVRPINVTLEGMRQFIVAMAGSEENARESIRQIAEEKHISDDEAIRVMFDLAMQGMGPMEPESVGGR